MTAPMPLGPGGEFDRVRAIFRVLGGLAAGAGDDCALLPARPGLLAASTDASLEGVHFRLDWIGLPDAGRRATAAALSDLAGEGAEAAAVLAAVVVPIAAPEPDVVDLMRGVGEAAAAAGATVAGGDLVRGGDRWVIAVTVLGWSEAPVTRAGARPGDSIWVTGTLGGARAALEAWRRGDVPEAAARETFVKPVPRLAAGRWLAARGARAMLDLSDGLAADAGHLAAASEVQLRLGLERVPVHPAAIAEARRLDLPVQQFAAEGGEDYELLAALPPEFGDTDAREFERATGLALTRIGSVVRGSGVHLTLLGRPLALHGFDHFR